MIFTLHRYIFNELFRAFVLATAALTLMLSGGLLIPTIRDYGVSPGQIIHLLGYFLPITLTFVLPISALFAASLVYGRFAADRELDACRASGISLWTTVYPGLTLAMVVAAANLILSFYVAPAFIHRSESSVKANAEQILFRNIQRKGSYTLPQSDYRLYADRAVPQKNLLEGVVIVDSRAGESPLLVASKKALVKIETHRTYNKAVVVAQDASVFDESSFLYFGRWVSEHEFPPLLSDKIKFQKLEQIKRIQQNKMNFYPVRQLAMQGRGQLATEILVRDMRRELSHPEQWYKFYDVDESRGLMYLLSAGECTVDPSRSDRIQLSKPIRLLQYDTNRNNLVIQYDCSEGSISLEGDGTTLNLAIRLTNPTWQRPNISSGRAVSRYVPNIRFPAHLAAGLEIGKTLPILENVQEDRSALIDNPSPRLKTMCGQVCRELLKVDNEIYAELNTRLVLGLGCIPLILTGIALGIKNRGGHMLSAFGASAIPAAILIVFILSGKELTRNPGTPASTGVAVIWFGLVVLLILTVWMYRKMLRT